MELKHYLEYLQKTMTNKWNALAMKDLDGDTSYTYGELANEIARLHVTFRELGIKEGDKIALCGRNCANWGLIFLAIETYKALGAEVVEVSLPNLKHSIGIYYILATAECSSNLARFDGVRYGHRTDNQHLLHAGKYVCCSVLAEARAQ